MSTAKDYFSSILTREHLVDTLKKPQVIVRIVVMVVCIVFFGCIANIGGGGSTCLISGNDEAKQGSTGGSERGPCSLGLFVGVMGFLICLGFLAIDFLFELFSNTPRKWFVVIDLAVSALWSFLSLVAFAYMTNQWNKNNSKHRNLVVENEVRGAIAFSFFAIVGFGVLAGLAVYRHRFQSGTLSNSLSRTYGETTETQVSEPGPQATANATPTEPSDFLY